MYVFYDKTRKKWLINFWKIVKKVGNVTKKESNGELMYNKNF